MQMCGHFDEFLNGPKLLSLVQHADAYMQNKLKNQAQEPVAVLSSHIEELKQNIIVQVFNLLTIKWGMFTTYMVSGVQYL